MRACTAFLLIAAPLAVPVAPAAAQAADRQAAISGPDPIIVTGDDRLVCRRITRTATRMRTGRICRHQSQWGEESRASREAYSNADAEEAAQTFDGLHADDRSTGCGYEGHETTLGPR